jgi:hypothetical protein
LTYLRKARFKLHNDFELYVISPEEDSAKKVDMPVRGEASIPLHVKVHQTPPFTDTQFLKNPVLTEE